MTQTKQELVIAWIKRSGWLYEVKHRTTTKYRIFSKYESGGCPFAFVGKHGALRFGLTVGKSIARPLDYSKLRVIMAITA